MPNITYVDPKFIDGEPWEVAEQAGAQLLDSFDFLLEALEAFRWAARGAWLSQEDHRTSMMPEGAEFDQSPVGRRLIEMHEQLTDARKRVEAAKLSASYDPRATL